MAMMNAVSMPRMINPLRNLFNITDPAIAAGFINIHGE